MSTELLDLWPTDLDLDAPSPLMILNIQAEALTRRTKGVIRGEVTLNSEVPTGGEASVEQLNFDLVAPAVGFRQRLLFVRYGKETLYPVAVMSDAFENQAPTTITPTTSDRTRAHFAASPQEVKELLKLVFNAPTTKATLSSLIARSNEVRAKSQAKAVSANGNEASSEG